MEPDERVCGSKRTAVIQSKAKGKQGRWYVACFSCGRVGRHGRTEAEAVRRWNGLATLYTGERD